MMIIIYSTSPDVLHSPLYTQRLIFNLMEVRFEVSEVSFHERNFVVFHNVLIQMSTLITAL